MNEPESVRDICRRKVQEWRERKEQQQFARIVDGVANRPEPQPDIDRLDGIDREFLSQMGIAW